jgi:hypothetical protein
MEINGDPLVLRRCGANRERERGREGERVVTRDGGSGDDGAPEGEWMTEACTPAAAPCVRDASFAALA